MVRIYSRQQGNWDAFADLDGDEIQIGLQRRDGRRFKHNTYTLPVCTLLAIAEAVRAARDTEPREDGGA
jgi:hypothetical protein